jgi:hypothetical protein
METRLLQLQPDWELVVAVDRPVRPGLVADASSDPRVRFLPIASQGYIESVLDEALTACRGEYILRLDDDETLSPRAVRWLGDGGYREADHWKWPRAHLWGSPARYIPAAPLWPDWQTRLSVREKAGGRGVIHAGSPFGGGEEAPGAILHWKFLVRDRASRRAILDRYETIQPGAGTGFLPFHLPEEAWAERADVGVPTAPWEDPE